ncbi:MAG: LLM class F420-dependent oxidoreductase [Actinomycetota bacterium]|nr:LLM class F420-dependent oxidoreductase [Actinomycetota bacterium]
MQVGVTFPQSEIGADPIAIRDYAQAAEDLGYEHLLAYDHVLGADPTNREGWRGYTHETMFHEPLILFGYLAAITRRLEFVSGVIVLPQRQTALVAKQAAEIDVLSSGRLRLGVGIGWNAVEYEALGESFGTRGARIGEQVEVMRLLWTKEVVSYEGKYHRIVEAGINPLPVQRPIPVWMGARVDVGLRRTARLADGWIPLGPPDDRMREAVERLRLYAEEAGRDPRSVGIEARLDMGRVPPEEWAAHTEAWRSLGATHISVNTMNAGLASLEDHIEAIRRFKEALGG